MLTKIDTAQSIPTISRWIGSLYKSSFSFSCFIIFRFFFLSPLITRSWSFKNLLKLKLLSTCIFHFIFFLLLFSFCCSDANLLCIYNYSISTYNIKWTLSMWSETFVSYFFRNKKLWCWSMWISGSSGAIHHYTCMIARKRMKKKWNENLEQNADTIEINGAACTTTSKIFITFFKCFSTIWAPIIIINPTEKETSCKKLSNSWSIRMCSRVFRLFLHQPSIIINYLHLSLQTFCFPVSSGFVPSPFFLLCTAFQHRCNQSFDQRLGIS